MKKTFLVIAVGLIFAGGLYSATGQREAAKFDQFGDIYCNDEKARLDNFVNQLRDTPEAKGYIIFYGGRWDHYRYPHRARRRLPRRNKVEESPSVRAQALEVLGCGVHQPKEIAYGVASNPQSCVV